MLINSEVVLFVIYELDASYFIIEYVFLMKYFMMLDWKYWFYGLFSIF